MLIDYPEGQKFEGKLFRCPVCQNWIPKSNIFGSCPICNCEGFKTLLRAFKDKGLAKWIFAFRKKKISKAKLKEVYKYC